MAAKKIKTVENRNEFCRKVENGEVENPEEWYVRHPDNPALLKKVKDVEKTCAEAGELGGHSQAEVDEFKKHFLNGDKVHKNKQVKQADNKGDIVWKK
jgi:hypothetical protein